MRWLKQSAVFKADLEKLRKNEGHMPEDKFLVMSRMVMVGSYRLRTMWVACAVA